MLPGGVARRSFEQAPLLILSECTPDRFLVLGQVLNPMFDQMPASCMLLIDLKSHL